MRRIGWFGLGLTLIVGGCQAFRDAFSAHADQVARAEDQSLSAQRLAEMVASAKRMPVNQGTVSSLAYVWVDYALFAAALADNQPLTDSALVMSASWPIVSQLKWEHFHERLVTDRVTMTPAQVDSAYEAGDMRFFQHILLRVPQGASPGAGTGSAPANRAEVERQKRRQIETIVRQTRASGGANFAQLARQYSDDPGSKGIGGYLGVSERGDPLVPEFKDAAWGLGPGEMTDVVRSSYGFHVIRRPPLREVRAPYQMGIEERLQVRFDSLYLDSLAERRGVEVKPDAPAIARQSIQNINASWGDRRTLVSYRGGAFRVSDFTRWLHALEPQYVQGVANATDEQIHDFLRLLTQRDLLIWQADSAGVAVGEQEWAQIRAQHDSALRLLQTALNVSAQALADSAPDASGRRRIAFQRVNDYLERVLNNRAQFVPVPPFLAATLRARGDWEVSAAGVTQALSRAEALRAAVDSLAGEGEGEPRMTPAPGPAPVPGSGEGQEGGRE